MQTELLKFNVLSLDPAETPLKTWVTHEVQGARNTVRIEQQGSTPDEENDIVLIDITDFLTIAKLLQGH